jgi:hypothetical protein
MSPRNPLFGDLRRFIQKISQPAQGISAFIAEILIFLPRSAGNPIAPLVHHIFRVGFHPDFHTRDFSLLFHLAFHPCGFNEICPKFYPIQD